MRTFRTAIVIPLLALFVLVSTGTVYAQEYASRLPNVNDASDRKAIIAVVRAAKAVGSDLNGLRLVISSDCQCGGAYADKGCSLLMRTSLISLNGRLTLSWLTKWVTL